MLIRTAIVLLLSSGASVSWALQAADDCARVEDDRERLECFDRFFSDSAKETVQPEPDRGERLSSESRSTTGKGGRNTRPAEAPLPRASVPDARPSKAATPSARTPQAGTPEVPTPPAPASEARISEARISEARASEARTSEARTSGKRASVARPSEAPAPAASVSDARASKASGPSARTPQAATPEVPTRQAPASEARISEPRTLEAGTSQARASEKRASVARPSESLSPEAGSPEASRTSEPARVDVPDEEFGLKPKAFELGGDSREAVVLGDFDSWERGRRFRLQNGQVWQVIDYRRLDHKAENPTVTIKKGMLGAFYMHFEGRSRGVKIKRIR